MVDFNFANYTFPYDYDQLTHPQGKNDLSAEAKYYQRLMYKEAIYPAPTEAPKPLDTWYDKQLYGRLDRCQNTIIPERI